MSRLSTTTRLSIAMTSITLLLLLLARIFNLFPNPDKPLSHVMLFVAITTYVLFWLILQRTLNSIPSQAIIPEHIKTMLDTLSEGILIIDDAENILLANSAFHTTISQTEKQLEGHKVSELPWQHTGDTTPTTLFPWQSAIRTGQDQRNVTLTLLHRPEDESYTFAVNAMPVKGTDGRTKAAMVTFDNVSKIEEKNAQLERTLELLRDSRNRIKTQNDELRHLSMRDPLTGCLNRRAFFERFETEWSSAARHDYPLGCIMLDVDHFKAVNDTHGHASGDNVLQEIADILTVAARKTDSVSRYGGEEFCILLPHTDCQKACIAAEKLRQQIEDSSPSGVSMTVSLGVSALEFSASGPQELIDQADKALYAAKRTGRNRVVRWDEIPLCVPGGQAQLHTRELDQPERETQIPFFAVTALMSALEQRDVATATHSRNVADLCVEMAKGLMSAGSCFLLEIAALLHDIGKLGVPDAILLKPTALNEEEWEVMNSHNEMGIHIVNASFGSSELTNILRYSNAWYGGNPRHPDFPVGNDIPLRSRILLIADAYNAMTCNKAYRKAKTQEQAFAELRRCAGVQFDPQIVECFIDTITANEEDRTVTRRPTHQIEALRIGIEIERLAFAMEDQDIALLTSISQRLAAHAAKLGLPEIAERAETLRQAAADDKDSITLMSYTAELLELCRSHQSSCLTDNKPEPDSTPKQSPPA